MDRPYIDHRPPLGISHTTWEREDAAGRSRLLQAASELGLPLVILAPNGATWTPEIDPSSW